MVVQTITVAKMKCLVVLLAHHPQNCITGMSLERNKGRGGEICSLKRKTYHTGQISPHYVKLRYKDSTENYYTCVLWQTTEKHPIPWNNGSLSC